MNRRSVSIPVGTWVFGYLAILCLVTALASALSSLSYLISWVGLVFGQEIELILIAPLLPWYLWPVLMVVAYWLGYKADRASDSFWLPVKPNG